MPQQQMMQQQQQQQQQQQKQPANGQDKPLAATGLVGASGAVAVKVPLPAGAAKHFFIRLVHPSID